MHRRHLIYIPSFSEHVYRVMRSSTLDQRSNVSQEDLKFFRNETVMRAFCDHNPLEHLLMMLTKLGAYWNLRVCENVETADHIEQLSINQFQYPELRLDVMEAQAKNKVHYMESNEVALAMHLCAQNNHHKVYQLSVGARDATKRVRAIKSAYSVPFDEQLNDAIEATDDMNRLMIAQMNSIAWARKAYGWDTNQLCIMLALFDKRNGAMTTQDIAQATMKEGEPAYLKKAVGELKEKKYITSDEHIGSKLQVQKGKKKGTRIYYMITQVGIGKVMEYRKYVWELSFGQK